MKRERVGSLRQLDYNRVVRRFVGVVLFELHAQSPCLYSNRRVTLRIKSGGPPQHLSCDLVFLYGHTAMIQSALGEIAEQFTEGFGATKAMTINKPIYLLEELIPPNFVTMR